MALLKLPDNSRVDAMAVVSVDDSGPMLLAVLLSVLEGPRWHSSLVLSGLSLVTSAATWNWPPPGSLLITLSAAGPDGTSSAGALAMRRASARRGAADVVVGDDTGRLSTWRATLNAHGIVSAAEVAPPRPWHNSGISALAWTGGGIVSGGGSGDGNCRLLSLDAEGGMAAWPVDATSGSGADSPLAWKVALPPGSLSTGTCIAGLPVATAASKRCCPSTSWFSGRRDGVVTLLTPGAADAGAGAFSDGLVHEVAHVRLAPRSAGAVSALAAVAREEGCGDRANCTILILAGFEDGCVAAGDFTGIAFAPLRLLRAHSMPVRALATLRNGSAACGSSGAESAVASASDDTSVVVARLWPCAMTLAGAVHLPVTHADFATAAAFVPGSLPPLLLTGGWDGCVLAHTLPVTAAWAAP